MTDPATVPPQRPDDRADSMDRLEAAIELYLAWRADPKRPPREDFLGAHPRLRDLLEPLFDGSRLEERRDDPQDDRAAGPEAARRRTLGGDFVLGDEIGRGGMGVVYAARQLSLDREVAVKVLAGPAASARTLARFRREAATAGRLAHDGIVAIHGVGRDGDVHWFAMERIDGVPLDVWAGRQTDGQGRRELRAIVGAVAMVADALQFAHDAGVLHRDVKPANVLVRADGRPVLTDFGLARERDLPALSQTGEFAGTPYYVSPEQVAGAEPDARSDVFSLGVTLFELLTGERPFRGSTNEMVLHEILSREPLDPQRIEPELPRDLAAIALKALEKEPDRRYPSTAAMAADLRAFLAFRPVSAKRAGWLRRTLRTARREPLKATLVAVLAIGVPALGTLGAIVLRQRDVVEVGTRVIRRATVEELLLDASRARFLQDGAAADALLDRVLELGGGEEPVAVAAAALHHARFRRDGRMHAPRRALTILEAYGTLVDDEPGLGRIRALVLAELGRDAEAAALRERIGEPRTALDHYVVGYRLWNEIEHGDLDRLPTALSHLRQAVIRADRPNPIYLSTLAALASLAGDADLELELTAALQHHWPDSPIARIFEVLYWYERDDAVCAAAAARLTALLPDYYWGHFKRGEMAERAGDLDEAIAHYEAALARFDGDRMVPFCLGRTLQSAGRHAEASRWFDRTLELDPGSIAAALYLTETLFATERDARAAELLDGVARFAPDRDDVQRVVANYALERRASLAANAPAAADLLDVGRAAADRAVELTARGDANSLKLAAWAAELGGDRDAAAQLRAAAARLDDG